MVRKTSGLFLCVSENVIFSLVMGYLAHGIMDLVYPLDFSPFLRGWIESQRVIVLVTGGLVAAISSIDRTRLVVQPWLETPASYAEHAEGEGNAEGDETNKKKKRRSEGQNLADWIRVRMGASMFSMAVVNAYGIILVGACLYFFALMLQGAGGWGLDPAISKRVRAPSVNATRYAYASSPRLDWIQACAGSSGWSALGNSTYGASQDGFPVAGSAFVGVTAAFASVTLLLSLYMSLMAIPEGGSSYMVFEPRGLVVCNALLVMGSVNGVDAFFAGCEQDVAGRATVFAIFCVAACWGDEAGSLGWWLLSRCVPAMRAPAGTAKWAVILDKIYRILWLSLVSWAPAMWLRTVDAVTSGPDTFPYMVATFSYVVSVSSTLLGWLDVLLFSSRWDSLRSSIYLISSRSPNEEGNQAAGTDAKEDGKEGEGQEEEEGGKEKAEGEGQVEDAASSAETASAETVAASSDGVATVASAARMRVRSRFPQGKDVGRAASLFALPSGMGPLFEGAASTHHAKARADAPGRTPPRGKHAYAKPLLPGFSPPPYHYYYHHHASGGGGHFVSSSYSSPSAAAAANLKWHDA